MKVFSISGSPSADRTSLAMRLLKELRHRNYQVALIKNNGAKDLNNEDNRDLRNMGIPFINRYSSASYQFYPKYLSLAETLSMLDADWIIVESNEREAIPGIVCVDDERQLPELVNGTTLAVCGKSTELSTEYDGVPVFHSENEIKALTDLIEKKVFEVLPLSQQKCCGECGFSCYKMVELILKGEKNREDCPVDRRQKIRITLAGTELKIVPYVQKTFHDIIVAYLQNLKGYKEGSDIKIEITDR